MNSYGIYAASASAGNAVFRSTMGGTMPLAGAKMYQALGPHWSGAMLSIIEFAMIPIPFVFYRYGHRIRDRSALITRMREDKERLEGKKRKAEPIPPSAPSADPWSGPYTSNNARGQLNGPPSATPSADAFAASRPVPASPR